MTTTAVAATFRVAPRYAFHSQMVTEPHARLDIAVDATTTNPPRFAGKVKDVPLVRDLLASLLAVQHSDYRYKGRDRAAYLAYLLKQGKKANKDIWLAQKGFLESQFREQQVIRELDPLCTVHDDGVSWEVFSKDESSYARLHLSNAAFDGVEANSGTALMAWPEAMRAETLEALPGYQPLHLNIGSAGVGKQMPISTAYDVNSSWLRGFLQVQSAATMADEAPCVLAPIDLYNVLLQLRMRKAKTPPRGLRLELIPGQRPRVAIEPWEVVLEAHGEPYAGKTARVIRMYGRQRLLLLQRLLPHAQRVEVRALGAGLPSFFVLHCGPATLTLAMSGWSEAGWAASACFDRLMPAEGPSVLGKELSKRLQKDGPQPLSSLVKGNDNRTQTRAALQTLCLRGQAVFDVATQRYQWRPLFAEPVGDDVVKFGSAREEAAHRLLALSNAVRLTKLHQQESTIEVCGEVDDRAAHRVYAPRFVMDAEGKASEAFCTCPAYRRAGMREGPCEHMLAIRVAFARQREEQEQRRGTVVGRAQIHAETRTLMRRDDEGRPVLFRISLDGNVVRVRRQEPADALSGTELARHQRIGFDSADEARDAYFQRLDALSNQGFVDGEGPLG
jgi:SWIM zinc finger